MNHYHCSIYAISDPLPQRIILWRLNGVTRMGNARALTKEEKRMLKPKRSKRTRTIKVADLDEYQ